MRSHTFRHITFACWHTCGLLNVVFLQFCGVPQWYYISSISMKVCPTRGVRSWLFYTFSCSFVLWLLWAIQSWGGAWYILVQSIHSKTIVCQEWKHEVNLYPCIYPIWCDFPHLRKMIVADAGDEILGQRAIFQETLRHLLWSICEGSRGTDTCFCVCVGGWVSCVSMSCVCSRCLDGFRYLSW